MKRRGFTLLELLVAVSLFSLLLVAMQLGLRFALNAVQHQDQTRDFVAGFEAADRAVRLLIERIDPSDAPALVGSDRAMRCATVLPNSASWGSLPIRATLGVDHGGRLVLIWASRVHVSPVVIPATTETPLLDDIDRIEIAYGVASDADWQWLPAWDQSELPGLIRVRIVPRGGGQRIWPDIIAAPRRAAGT